MKAEYIFENKRDAFIRMERYVNNGSPSGWTKIRSTSEKTHPFFGLDQFPILEFPDDDIQTEIIGDKNAIFDGRNFAHPDSILSTILQQSSRVIRQSSVMVSPTSGGRTMFVQSGDYDGFIKLTYDVNRIGRVDRQLKTEHCLSSIEVSQALKNEIDKNRFSESYATLLEKSAKISKLQLPDGIYEWGTIVREFLPYPYVIQNRAIIPGFSMFATDWSSDDTKEDSPLIVQLINLSGVSSETYLKNILRMTVDAWFETLLNCAFILEMHGQNCYYEIDENFCITRIVIKDMDSVDKDISLAKKLGLRSEWASFPFECFYEDYPEDHPWYYKIRPSYMYDFKLGTYLLKPIIDVVCTAFDLDNQLFEKDVKNYVNETYIQRIPDGYFPIDGTWYYCDNSERKPGERRKYYSKPNPLFR